LDLQCGLAMPETQTLREIFFKEEIIVGILYFLNGA
jgi:hypothetical protein